MWMRAIILAAGLGTRLGSFGKNILSQNESSVVNQNGINFSSENVLNYNFLDSQTRGLYQWNSPNRWSLNQINKERIEKYRTYFLVWGIRSKTMLIAIVSTRISSGINRDKLLRISWVIKLKISYDGIHSSWNYINKRWRIDSK